MLKLRVKASYDVFNDIFLPVAGLKEGQLSGIGEFLWDLQECVLNAIHVLWIRGRQFQDFIDPQNFPFFFRMLYALEIA